MVASVSCPDSNLTEEKLRPALLLIAVCFTFSGAAGLIYEVLWMRMLGLVFGATTIAVSVVLAAFMGGLALGSAFAARVVPRMRRPLRAYGWIEIVIGLYAVAVPAAFRVIDHLDAILWQRIHPSAFGFAIARFLFAGIVLLVPTALMGATLPMIVAAIRRSGATAPQTISRLYGLNLFGAIGGTLAGGFLLLPGLGIRVTIWIAAATNLVIGIAVLIAARSASVANSASSPEPAFRDETREGPRAQSPFDRALWFGCAFASGFITIGMQVVWSRILSMIIGSSTYAFTLVLALFLVGLAAGAWVVGLVRETDGIRLRRLMFIVQLLIVLSLFFSFRLTSGVPGWLIRIGFALGIDSWHGLLALQVFAGMVLVLVPATLMGMIMPIVFVWTARAEAAEKLVGQTYALNTLGAIAGAIVTTFVLIPMATSRLAVFVMVAISILIAAVAYRPKKTTVDVALVRSLAVGTAAVIVIAGFFLWPWLNLNELSIGAYDSFVRVLAQSRSVPNKPNGPNDHQLLMYDEGRTATVSVRRDWGITSIAINGRTNASDADDMPTQILLGQLGVLVAPRLDRALLVGFASGVTTGSVLQSSIASVECVELERAAISSARFFEHVNNHPLSDRRLRMIVDDARTYLRVNPAKYDLIISEPSHPWVPGVANLFTREFFMLGRERLQDDGVFVQWLQIYQLSNESLRSILATFHEAFPHVALFRVEGAAKGKDLILLGSRQSIDLNRMTQRVNDARGQLELNRIGLHSAEDVRAWFVCDERKLGPAVKGAVINTDDNMHVETAAPREAFRPTMEENASWIDRLRE
ncbi:MAG TPA: fused MFS/spermidine synthase [Pyrinomonadaceae bacterium]|nr:fused MFS/spermidine synthase [Pyrinomonadaceae bacterium]